MKVRQILLLVFLGASFLSNSQTLVTGVVLDENSSPMIAATVWMKNFGLEATSDSLGNFEIFVPPNNFLLISKEGYYSTSQKISQNTPLPLTFRLKKKQATDNTVLVKGTVIDYTDKTILVGVTVFSPDFATESLTNASGQFEVEVNIGSTILLDYGRTESFVIEYGGEQAFELFKPKPIPIVGNQLFLQQEHFNKGNIHHPLQLIQARVPGMMMSKGGGNNPFGQFHTRLHGLSTLNGERPGLNKTYTTVDPLVVVDGVPEVDISMLDPLSIQSMKIIKDGMAAKYGMRGASGVIEITTHHPSSSGFQYHSFLGIDRLDQTMQFFRAEDYRNAKGGNDLGKDTNWFEEISRTAFTHTHQLSLSKQHPKTAYRLSLLYKNAEGILKKQGYEKLQMNGYFKQMAFDDRLQIEAMLRSSIQDDNYSQPLAFRYAQSYNPTAPVFSQNSEYGGYFEQALFDYYNPVALLTQNPHRGEQRQVFTKLMTQYQLFPSLKIAGTYSNDHYKTNSAQYFSENSFWKGPNQDGLANQRQATTTQHFLDAYLVVTPLSSPITSFKIGHQYQLQQQLFFSLEGGEFLMDAFNFNNIKTAEDFANRIGVVHSNRSQHRLAAFYGIMDFNWDDHVLVQAGLRIEGSSRLGSNNQWGRFPFVALTSYLGKRTDGFFQRHNIQVKASFGITGNLPYDNYLSIRRYSKQGQFFYNGDFTDIYGIAFESNPYLAWEQKREWNLGIYAQPIFFNKAVTLSVNYYNNKIKGILQTLRNQLGRSYFGNIARIKNQGWEAMLELELLRKRAVNWQTSLLIDGTTSLLDNYGSSRPFYFGGYPNQRRPTVPSAEGNFKTNSVLIEDGSTIADLLFLEFEGISSDGQWIFTDANSNGIKNEITDKTIVGNGLPNWTLGWNNSLRFWDFKLNVFFRGAFGHDLFNLTRQLTENPEVLNTYNVLNTTFKGESAKLTDQPQESSYYVENASFLRLDNLQLSYALHNPKKLPFQSLQVYLAANNLFTISGYKGWDPDYRLQSENDVLAIGYEFRSLYLPTKSWVLGVKVGLP